MEQPKGLVIAIDGPASAGKSTVAQGVAKELGLRYLDTGAMYRAFALHARRAGLEHDDSSDAVRVCRGLTIEFEGDPQRVLLNGEDVTELIRMPHIGELASALSVDSDVRRLLAGQQRRAVEQGGVVLEGRDTTTVVAPDADVRVFLTAGLEVRAERRARELHSQGLEPTLDEVRAGIEQRDRRDSTRADSPLHIADGVRVIESDRLSPEDVIQQIVEMARAVGDKKV